MNSNKKNRGVHKDCLISIEDKIVNNHSKEIRDAILKIGKLDRKIVPEMSELILDCRDLSADFEILV